MATSLKNIAVFGATGNIGLAITKQLLARKSEFSSITAVTASNPSLPKFDFLKQQGVKIIQADLSSPQSLVEALKGQDAVILALGSAAFDQQIKIVDAAIAAGVKRVYPSEFGYDYSLPQNQLDVLSDKLAIRKYLVDKANEGKISYTFLVTGSFLDWALATSFIGFNLKDKTASLINNGADEVYFTTSNDVGRFLASSLIHSELSHNKVVRVRSFSATGAQILALLEKHSNSKYTVTNKSSEQLKEEIEQHKKKGELTDYFIKQVIGLHFSGNGVYSPIDNSSFPDVKNLDTVEGTVIDALAGKFNHFKLEN